MSRVAPQEGATATAETTVQESDLASALPLNDTDAFPAVWATTRMIALMEIASARVLTSCLADGELSVGVGVQVTHSAPTPVSAKVKAEAQYLGRDGKLFKFEVKAYDAGGQVGVAQHTRAIIRSEKLQQVALKRCEGEQRL